MPRLDAILRSATDRLIAADVATPALDARILVQHAFNISHTSIVTEPDRQYTEENAEAFHALLARRIAGEPVSRILGEREFYGRNFKTSPAVLDPRPDTETLIDLCLEHLPPDEAMTILDLGTGSGILALTLLAERPLKTAVAVDVSDMALAIAKENARTWGLTKHLKFVQGSWFESIEGAFDLIVSNPPYIASTEIPRLEIEVRNHDPHLALDGGPDGLDCYRAIVAGAPLHLKPHGKVAVEIGAGQKLDVTVIFQQNGFRLVDQKRDLGGHDRALLFCR